MKKRNTKRLAIILAAVLLLSCFSGAFADQTGICFVAANDKLYELGYMPLFLDSSAYVPSDVFSYFGIYTSYFKPDNTTLLYTNSKQIFFNLTTGKSYDSYYNTYDVSAVYRNGLTYVPVAWVCQYFGLTYSYIAGSGNGDIVRINNGTAVLNDADFIRAAGSLMRSRYNEYFGVPETSKPPQDVPIAQEEEDRQNTRVSLCFNGLPSKKMLELISGYGYTAAFFLTAEQVEENPELVRELYGSGHSLGIFCGSEPRVDAERALDAFFAVCQYRPLLISSTNASEEAVREYASKNALFYFDPQLNLSTGDTTAASTFNSIEAYGADISVSLAAGEKTLALLPKLLQSLSLKHYSVTALRETNT